MSNSNVNKILTLIIPIVYAILYYYNITKFDFAIYIKDIKIFRIDIVLLIGVISVITLLVYKYRKQTCIFDYLIEALCTVISVACILSIIVVI